MRKIRVDKVPRGTLRAEGARGIVALPARHRSRLARGRTGEGVPAVVVDKSVTAIL